LRDPHVLRQLPEAGNRAREVIFLPIEYAQKLVDSPAIELRRRVRYMIAFCTGLRDGEIAGLTWNDLAITAEIPYLRVDKAVALYGHNGRIAEQSPKTSDSARRVPLHPELRKALEEWKRDGWELFMGRSRSDADYVFPSNRKQQYMAARNQMSRPDSPALLRADLEALNLPTHEGGQPFTFHATRRSFATWLTDAGVADADIKRLMGHTANDVTHKFYTAAVLKRLREAVVRISLRWGAASEALQGGKLGPLLAYPSA
jgi:integrase